MGSINTNVAAVPPAAPAEGNTAQNGSAQSSDMLAAYQAQCRKLLGEHDGKRDGDSSRPHDKKKQKTQLAALGSPWAHLVHALPERPFVPHLGGGSKAEHHAAPAASSPRTGPGAGVSGTRSMIGARAAGIEAAMRARLRYGGADVNLAGKHVAPDAGLTGKHVAPDAGLAGKHVAPDAGLTRKAAALPTGGVDANPLASLAAGLAAGDQGAQRMRSTAERGTLNRQDALAARESLSDTAPKAHAAPDIGAADSAPVLTHQLPSAASEPGRHTASAAQAPRQARQVQERSATTTAAAPNEAQAPQGTSVRYSFKTWEGQPAVDLRFDSQLAANIVTARPTHHEVKVAMQQHVDLLASDMTVQFDRQPSDEQGERSRWARQEQETDEQ
jgi:hypothetical protein